VGAFQEFNGLSAQTEVFEIKEGGLNSHSHKFITRTSYGDLTLKQGFVGDPALFDWFDDTSLSTWPRRLNGSIYMYNDDPRGKISAPSAKVEEFVPACAWDFFRAFPIKWEGPSGNASSSGVAVMSLTLACEWVELRIL
jgi:phage tail-like protein